MYDGVARRLIATATHSTVHARYSDLEKSPKIGYSVLHDQVSEALYGALIL
jgi:hypothetical protein